MQSTRTARYIDVLRLPRVPGTFGAALIGRGAYALVFLPLFYAVADATGSVGLAGIAVGLYGAGASFLAPVRAWFIDHFGARRVLSVLVVIFGGTLAAIGLSALCALDGAVLIVLAAVAGVFAPPLGPTMRVAWGRLAPTSDLLKKALSFDAVVEELLYLGGPVAAGVALAFIAPGAALLVPAGLVLVGGLLFVVTRTVGEMAPQPRADAGSRRDRPLVFDPRFVAVLIPTLVAGAVSGSIGVSVPVVVSDAGGPAAAGIALGIFAGGSAVGGLLFGALRVPGSPLRQLLVLSAALVAISSLIALAAGAVSVTIVLAAAGLFFSPVMIVAYFAAHQAGREHRQNSATTWVNTGHNIGAAAGSALAGIIIQAASVPAATMGIASGAALLLVAGAVLGTGRRTSRNSPDREFSLHSGGSQQ
ncbi:MAG: MFS transporter [Actinomycetota bacterium]